jgi:hypothetical protein
LQSIGLQSIGLRSIGPHSALGWRSLVAGRLIGRRHRHRLRGGETQQIAGTVEDQALDQEAREAARRAVVLQAPAEGELGAPGRVRDQQPGVAEHRSRSVRGPDRRLARGLLALRPGGCRIQAAGQADERDHASPCHRPTHVPPAPLPLREGLGEGAVRIPVPDITARVNQPVPARFEHPRPDFPHTPTLFATHHRRARHDLCPPEHIFVTLANRRRDETSRPSGRLYAATGQRQPGGNCGMSTILDTWTIDSPGTWSVGGNWLQNVNNTPVHQQPNSGNDAVLSPSGTTPFVVTYNETDTVNSLAGNQYATLDLTGGTLTIDTNAGFSGGVLNQAGTLVLVNGWSETGASGLGTAAAYVIEAGAFVIGSGATTDTLAGTVSGAGNFYLNNASSFILAQGFKISSGTWELGNGNDGFGSNTTLDTDVGYTGIFKLDDYSGNAANLFLNGETLTLAGTQAFDGYISGTGTLVQSGTAEASQLTINNNALVIVNGTVNQDGGVTIGNGTTPDTTSLDIGGVWAFTTDTSLTGYGASTIDNEGTIVKNGGSTSSTISGSLFIENGVLTAGTATLSISAATNEIAGLLNGAGNIYFAGGESFTLDPGVSITSAIWELGVSGNGSRSSTTLDTNVTYAGTFRLDNYTGNAANLYLNNETLTLSGGATLNGYIGGPGKIAITGSADIVGEGADGGVVFSVTGLLTQDAGFNLGGKMLVGATGTYDLRSDDGIVNNDTVSIVNAGLIEKTAGTGSSILNGGASSTGTIDVATGTLGFSGSGGSLSGAIEGAGTFLLGGTGTYTLASTLVATVGSILISDYDSSTSLNFSGNFTYGGTFDTSLTFGTQNFNLAGHTFTLTNAGSINAAYDTVTFTGGGRVLLASAANIEMYGVGFAGGMTLENQGLLTDGFTIALDSDGASSATMLLNDAGATLALASANNGITNGGSLATLVNQGLIENTTGAIANIQVTLDSTGTLATGSGTLVLSDGGTLDGSVTGAGVLQLGGNATYTLAPTVQFAVSTLLISDYDSSTSLVFGGNLTYGGTFDTSLTFGTQNFDLAGYTFDLTNAGSINTAYDTLTFTGGGELLLGPASNIEMSEVDFGGGVVLENQGSLTENYVITLDGDSVGGASTLQNDAGATFVLVGGGAAVNNGGTTGVINNAGLIVKNTGTGGATISGVRIANSGTILVSSGGLTLGGSVAGAGTLAIGANSALALSAATSNTIAFEGAGATLYLGSAASVTGAITGLASGDTIDLQGVGFVEGSYAAGSGTVGALTAGTRTFTIDGAAGGLYFNSQSDGNGGTDIVVSSVPGASSSTPPATNTAFTSTSASQIQTALAALIPSGATPYVVSVTGAAFSAPPVPGTLNVLVATTSAAGATLVLPTGFLAGYLLAGAATLEDSVGGALLVDEASGANLQGAANDTLFGGNSAATLSATTGAETLIGGTATTLFFLGGSNAFVSSQGSDTIIGSSAADTVNATAAALYFGASGTSVVNVQGPSTIIGGTGGNTVTGGAGDQLIFGSSSLDYIGGAGSATIIGGGGGNTVTGGSGNLLIFASSSLTYNGTGGAATIIGGGGAVNAYLGAGGGIAYGSPGGNDTLASGSGLSILVGGGGGDLLVASGAANDTMVAGGGNETLTGSGATGSLVLFGGPGNDVLIGGTGNDLFIAEPGNATMTGGGGTNSYVFIATPGTTRTDVITDFNPNQDAIGLFGYGAEPGADAAALASATSAGGNTVVTLSDGTSIVMVGAPTLHSYNFF